jgi:anti-sigma regulatory factor (Ser/Thr protein kinase)
VKTPKNLALGIFPKYESEITLSPCKPGEKWLLFTDGINEGRNAAGEDYGFDRLRASLEPGAASDIITLAWSSWQNFVAGIDAHDDACMAVIVTKPPDTLEMTSEPKECKQARNYVEDWARVAGYSDLERGRIVLAADEAITNVIRHTYRSTPDRPIILTAALTDGLLHLRMRDYGPPVNKEELKGRELEDVKPGGLGLMLLRTVFSVVEHVPLADGNEWHLAKPLP